MSQRKKKFIIITVILGLFTIFIVNAFIYPFNPGKPIYADIEETFDKIWFPPAWQEIKASENRGSAYGRMCGIENSTTCFHKSKTFKVPEDEKKETVVRIMQILGCKNVESRSHTYNKEDGPVYGYNCYIDNNIRLGSSFRGANNEVYFSVSGKPAE
jgi:hypothetical protein